MQSSSGLSAPQPPHDQRLENEEGTGTLDRPLGPRSPKPSSRRSAFHRRGSGEPLLLIHGLTDTWATWRPLLTQLEARHDVYAPTLPGHLGGPEITPRQPIDVTIFVDFLERQLDKLGFDRAHLVGNSYGGWLALELAARGRASSSVAICPAGGWYPHTRQDRMVAAYFRRNALLTRTGDWWVDAMAARPRLRRFATRELLAPATRLTGTEARTMFEGANGCRILEATLAGARRGSLFSNLGEMPCPVRVMYGTDDKILRWPGHYERLRALLPDAEYVPLPGLRHLAMWDDPAGVAARILEITAVPAR
jgi:pimeloyl-ACP methyl ester carboxylesterase